MSQRRFMSNKPKKKSRILKRLAIGVAVLFTFLALFVVAFAMVSNDAPRIAAMASTTRATKAGSLR